MLVAQAISSCQHGLTACINESSSLITTCVRHWSPRTAWFYFGTSQFVMDFDDDLKFDVVLIAPRAYLSDQNDQDLPCPPELEFHVRPPLWCFHSWSMVTGLKSMHIAPRAHGFRILSPIVSVLGSRMRNTILAFLGHKVTLSTVGSAASRDPQHTYPVGNFVSTEPHLCLAVPGDRRHEVSGAEEMMFRHPLLVFFTNEANCSLSTSTCISLLFACSRLLSVNVVLTCNKP